MHDAVASENLVVDQIDAVEQTSYVIDGVKVSNFCLPPFFEPVANLQGVKLDWMGLCKQPLEILPGGYGHASTRIGDGRWCRTRKSRQGHTAWRSKAGQRGGWRRSCRRGHSPMSVYGTVLGVPASYLAFAGSVEVVPVVGSTHGHGFAPKKEGLPVR